MWMKQKDEPIRVAQIMGKLWAGGVEMVVFNYYRAIDKSKIQFDFYYDADSTVEPPQDLIDMGARFYKIPPYQKLPQYIRELKKHLKENQYLIVHIPTQYIAEFVKKIGYDGIVFKSSLYNDENSVNVVIFNFDKCEAVGSVVYDVTRNDYTCEMEDPVSELRLNFQLQLTPDNN